MRTSHRATSRRPRRHVRRRCRDIALPDRRPDDGVEFEPTMAFSAGSVSVNGQMDLSLAADMCPQVRRGPSAWLTMSSAGLDREVAAHDPPLRSLAGKSASAIGNERQRIRLRQRRSRGVPLPRTRGFGRCSFDKERSCARICRDQRCYLAATTRVRLAWLRRLAGLTEVPLGRRGPVVVEEPAASGRWPARSVPRLPR